MAIGTPAPILSASSSSVTSSWTFNTSAGAPIGLIIGWAYFTNSTSGLTSVTDSVSNTYVIGAIQGNSLVGGFMQPFYSFSSTLLPSGGSISLAVGSSVGFIGVGAITCTGLVSIDLQGPGMQGSSASPSITTSALGNAVELLIASFGAGGGTVTEASGWTTQVAGPSTAPHVATLIVSSTASQTYNPTLSASVTWTLNYITFRGPPASSAFFQFLTPA